MLRGKKKNTVRKLLLSKLASITSKDSREDLIRERCNDPMDQMQNRFEMDLTISVINKDWETRKSIETALKLLDIDEYGICQDCGAEINPKRLEAIPWTTLCVYCQEECDAATVDVEPAVYQRAA